MKREGGAKPPLFITKSMILRILLFLLVIQSVVFFGHWVIYKTMTSFLNITRLEVLWRIRVVFILLGLLFVIASILTNQFSSPGLDWFYTAAAVWVGTVHILIMASVAYWAIYAIAYYSQIALPTAATGLAVYAVGLFLSGWGIYNSFNARLTPYTVTIPGLPESWKGRTAVMISDTHFGNIRGQASAIALAKKINSLNPDIVFIPGDYFDGPFADYFKLAAPLSTLKAPLGVFFASGNHEEFRESSPYWNAIALANVHMMNNRVETVDGLQIAGTTYAGSNTDTELSDTLSKIPYDRNQPLVLLKHAPFVPETAAKNNVSLMLSGHTHEGQMWPFSFITDLIYEDAAYGEYKRGVMTGITSSGYGTWGPPQRLGTVAEIVVIRFQ
jgi:hypothetical protein